MAAFCHASPCLRPLHPTRSVRRTPRSPTPCRRNALLIAVSGYAQDEDRRRSAREGFAAHLKKPVDLNEILGIMQGK